MTGSPPCQCGFPDEQPAGIRKRRRGRSMWGSPIGVGDLQHAVDLADFDDDGVLDVVYATYAYASHGVGVFMGVGDGSFSPGDLYMPGDQTDDAVSGDVDGDGVLDIVTAPRHKPEIGVLLGNGDGTFSVGAPSPIFTGAQDLALGDFDEDGALDVAAVFGVSSGDDVVILFGAGDGTFGQPVFIEVSQSMVQVDAVDLDDDGHVDVLVGAAAHLDGVHVLLGAGDGTFAAPVYHPAGFRPEAFDLVELNGDGLLDLAVANFYSDDISILLGNGDGAVRERGRPPGRLRALSIVAAPSSRRWRRCDSSCFALRRRTEPWSIVAAPSSRTWRLCDSSCFALRRHAGPGASWPRRRRGVGAVATALAWRCVRRTEPWSIVAAPSSRRWRRCDSSCLALRRRTEPWSIVAAPSSRRWRRCDSSCFALRRRTEPWSIVAAPSSRTWRLCDSSCFALRRHAGPGASWPRRRRGVGAVATALASRCVVVPGTEHRRRAIVADLASLPRRRPDLAPLRRSCLALRRRTEPWSIVAARRRGPGVSAQLLLRVASSYRAWSIVPRRRGPCAAAEPPASAVRRRTEPCSIVAAESSRAAPSGCAARRRRCLLGLHRGCASSIVLGSLSAARRSLGADRAATYRCTGQACLRRQGAVLFGAVAQRNLSGRRHRQKPVLHPETCAPTSEGVLLSCLVSRCFLVCYKALADYAAARARGDCSAARAHIFT